MTRKARRKRLKEFNRTRARAASRCAPPWMIMGAFVASTALVRGTAVPVYARELEPRAPVTRGRASTRVDLPHCRMDPAS
jgi:hypothetical protein